ncbi:MAG: NrtA/SsuA/CpmA family ABC transporter substrate-binding protein [Chloroflexi bacterium]|nr:NrtA/SsuA/CpmA family ABC transporter substrate-binding protein [Chloroflexota bacterium]
MKGIVTATAVAVAIALMAFGTWYGLNSATGYSGTPEPISIGIPPNEQSALVFIAEEQRLFARNGLSATVKVYDTALAAINAMKNDEVDIAQSAEYPIVTEALKKARITVIGIVDRHQTVSLVARKDRGIENISDIEGKRIGVPHGTITEFYLGRFLNLHGISLQDVTTVDMSFAQSADALASGTVDAFQVRNKDINPIRERLGSNVITWPSQSGQVAYEVISGRSEWVNSHPRLIDRLLNSILQAEEFAIRHPAEAMAILQRRLNYDDAYLASVGPQHQYSLSLEQSLVLAMEDEARWMIGNNLTGEKQTPNFIDYIHVEGLKAVRPGAVNIIR